MAGIRSLTTYTAAGQLYFSLTPALAPDWNFTWHWYDAEGRRVRSQVSSRSYVWENGALPRPDSIGGVTTVYVYDGSDPILVLTSAATGGPWQVRQRLLGGGIDEPLAGRYVGPAGFENLVLVGDWQHSTVAAVTTTGSLECLADVFSVGAFGVPEGLAPACGGGKCRKRLHRGECAE